MIDSAAGQMPVGSVFSKNEQQTTAAPLYGGGPAVATDKFASADTAQPVTQNPGKPSGLRPTEIKQKISGAVSTTAATGYLQTQSTAAPSDTSHKSQVAGHKSEADSGGQAAYSAETSSAAKSGQDSQNLGSYFFPKTERDPTLSPHDYAKLKEEEERKIELERQRRLMQMRKKKQESPVSRLSLQGIVGSDVIINGEMYRLGGAVGGAKIIKIGANYVVLDYKGKSFKLFLQ